MRTAQIVYEFPSVSETFVLAQMRGLAERGWDVRIFADSKGGNSELSADVRDLSDRVTYFGLPFKRARELVGRFKSRTSAGESKAVAPSRPQPDGMRLRLEARAFSEQGRFDIVHSHFGPNGVRAVRLRAKGVLSAPVITSFYGYDVTRHWSRDGYGELFSRGNCFVALSEMMRGQLIELGAPAARVVIHRLGVNVDQFSRAVKAGDRVELISIARLVEKKGIEFGLRAVATLLKKNLRVKYTVVGDGPMRGELQSLASRLGVSQHVEFIGAASHERIAQLLSASDILVAPSVTATDGDTEGTPVAILEAMASRLPVVATAHSAIPEIVLDGLTGFLVSERDDAALADRIERLAEDRSLRNRMGDEGRAFVRKNHDIVKLNDDLARLYNQVKEQHAAV